MTNMLLDKDTKKEDIYFNEDQRTIRQVHMSGHDKNFKTKILNKMERKTKQMERIKRRERMMLLHQLHVTKILTWKVMNVNERMPHSYHS